MTLHNTQGSVQHTQHIVQHTQYIAKQTKDIAQHTWGIAQQLHSVNVPQIWTLWILNNKKTNRQCSSDLNYLNSEQQENEHTNLKKAPPPTGGA